MGFPTDVWAGTGIWGRRGRFGRYAPQKFFCQCTTVLADMVYSESGAGRELLEALAGSEGRWVKLGGVISQLPHG